MRITIISTIILYYLLLLTGCCKDPQVPDETKTNCYEMYDRRSKEYINPYMGTLETAFPGTPQSIFPERYSYNKPSPNPNNPYEFCYLRNDHTLSDKQELYTYNFCNGKSTKLFSGVARSSKLDWGKKNWILFNGENGDLYKIKSNGDDLTYLIKSRTTYLKWNPSGTLFLAEETKVFDENGDLAYEFPHQGYIIDWYDDLHILTAQIGAKEVTKYKLENGQTAPFAPIPSGFYHDFNKERNELLGILDSMNLFKNILYKVNTNETIYLSNDYRKLSFRTGMQSQLDNKILAVQQLADTMTGSPALINQRSHIALMDKDGSNIRQVLLQE